MTGGSTRSRSPAKDMIWVAGGEFQMGSERFYPEESPVRCIYVDGFWIDEHPVTVAEFRRFVKATGYVTVTERPPNPTNTLTPTRGCSIPVPWSFIRRRGLSISESNHSTG